jgi:hypothetical protein
MINLRFDTLTCVDSFFRTTYNYIFCLVPVLPPRPVCFLFLGDQNEWTFWCKTNPKHPILWFTSDMKTFYINFNFSQTLWRMGLYPHQINPLMGLFSFIRPATRPFSIRAPILTLHFK